MVTLSIKLRKSTTKSTTSTSTLFLLRDVRKEVRKVNQRTLISAWKKLSSESIVECVAAAFKTESGANFLSLVVDNNKKSSLRQLVITAAAVLALGTLATEFLIFLIIFTFSTIAILLLILIFGISLITDVVRIL